MQLPEHSYPTPVDGDEAECADVDYSIDVHQHDTAKFLSEYSMDRRWHSASSLPPQPDGGVSSFGSYTTPLVWDQLPASTTRIDGYLEDFGFGQRGNVGAFDVHSGPGAREVNGWPRPTSSNDLAFSEYTNPQSAYPGVIPGLLYGSSSGCSPKNVSMYEPVCNNVLMAQHGSAPGDGNNYFSEAELEILEYSTVMTEQQAQHDQGKIYKRGFEASWLTAEQSISIHSSSSWQQRVGRGRRSRMDQQERFRPPRRKSRQTTISINQIRSIFPHLSSVIQTTTTT